MIWPFGGSSKNFLGIDIGTSAIKVVELSRMKDRIKLENYGEMAIHPVNDRPFRSLEKNSLLLSDRQIAGAINKIFSKARISTREAFFSIPDFSSFFTFLELPPMSKEELPSAVQFESRQHIPLPLSEVALDWSVVGNQVSEKAKSKIKVLLVAVPYSIINQYQAIAKICQVKLISLEAEIFGLARALIKNKKEGVIGLVDIGAQSTTFNIVENGNIKITHSFDVAGNELTRDVAKSLNVGYNEAEELKRKDGIASLEAPIAKILIPQIDLLGNEIEKISQDYYQNEGKSLEKIILAGGLALLPGLKNYVSKLIAKPVEIGNPFADFLYPPVLAETLRTMGPAYAIAVGVALRGFEQK